MRSTGTGGLTESSSYDPFGLPSTGAAAEVSAARLRFGYHDELSLAGLVHLRAREYDPALGRFTTPDLLDGVPGEPTVANRYPYAANDPLGAADPLGPRPYGDGDLNGSYGSSSGPDAWRDRFDPLLLSTALTAVDLAEHSARHRAVQVYFSTTVRPGTRMEVPIPGSGTNGGTGFADLVNGVEVWEVKPDRRGGRPAPARPSSSGTWTTCPASPAVTFTPGAGLADIRTLSSLVGASPAAFPSAPARDAPDAPLGRTSDAGEHRHSGR